MTQKIDLETLFSLDPGLLQLGQEADYAKQIAYLEGCQKKADAELAEAKAALEAAQVGHGEKMRHIRGARDRVTPQHELVVLLRHALTCASPGLQLQWKRNRLDPTDASLQALREECGHPLVLRLPGRYVPAEWSGDDRYGCSACVICGFKAQDRNTRNENDVLPLQAGVRHARYLCEGMSDSDRRSWDTHDGLERMILGFRRLDSIEQVLRAFLEPKVAVIAEALENAP